MLSCHARLATPRSAHGLSGWARAWVWGVLVAFALATLAPAVSRTLDHGKPLQQRGWLAVCSTQGAVWVQTDLGGNTPTPFDGGLSHFLDACAYCVHASDRAAPPPAVGSWGLAPCAPWSRPTWAGHVWRVPSVGLPPVRGPPAST